VTTAPITVHQQTPSSGGSGDGKGQLADEPVASSPARTVSTARGGTASGRCLVQVFARRSGSRQRQRRFDQTSRAGRPKQGRSRISTRIRSWASAIARIRCSRQHPPSSPRDHNLGAGPIHVQHHEPVECDDLLGMPCTVSRVRGPSVVAVVKQQPDVGASGRDGGWFRRASSPLQRVEPYFPAKLTRSEPTSRSSLSRLDETRPAKTLTHDQEVVA
jgi:hypothetical protein